MLEIPRNLTLSGAQVELLATLTRDAAQASEALQREVRAQMDAVGHHEGNVHHIPEADDDRFQQMAEREERIADRAEACYGLAALFEDATVVKVNPTFPADPVEMIAALLLDAYTAGRDVGETFVQAAVEAQNTLHEATGGNHALTFNRSGSWEANILSQALASGGAQGWG